jgi:hypothetical protein
MSLKAMSSTLKRPTTNEAYFVIAGSICVKW